MWRFLRRCFWICESSDVVGGPPEAGQPARLAVFALPDYLFPVSFLAGVFLQRLLAPMHFLECGVWALDHLGPVGLIPKALRVCGPWERGGMIWGGGDRRKLLGGGDVAEHVPPKNPYPP